jgi:RNA polymerase-binding transcription factor DksA
MTKAQQETYRQRLVALRDRFKGTVSHLANEALRNTGGEASGSLSNTPIHMADLGSDNFEQEFNLSLLENQGQRLEEIDAALARLDEGRYGQCEGEDCGKPIPKARLDALPFARYCVECARKQEQGA